MMEKKVMLKKEVENFKNLVKNLRFCESNRIAKGLGKNAFFLCHEYSADVFDAITALKVANAMKIRMISNKYFERAIPKLPDNGIMLRRCEYSWLLTGTFIAYEKPDKEIGRFIEFEKDKLNYVLEVKKGRGEKNVALVLNHGFAKDGSPLITFDEIGSCTIYVRLHPEAKINLIPHFPKTMGHYFVESRFGIPTGAVLKGELYNDKDARNFTRTLDNSFVGFVVREVCKRSCYTSLRASFAAHAPIFTVVYKIEKD